MNRSASASAKAGLPTTRRRTSPTEIRREGWPGNQTLTDSAKKSTRGALRMKWGERTSKEPSPETQIRMLERIASSERAKAENWRRLYLAAKSKAKVAEQLIHEWRDILTRKPEP